MAVLSGYLILSTTNAVTIRMHKIKSTVTGKCPIQVQELIDLANLTGGQEIQSLGDIWLGPWGAEGTPWSVAERASRDLPNELQAYIGPVRVDTRQVFVPRWDNVDRASRILTAVIKTAAGPVDVSKVGTQVAEMKRTANGVLEIVPSRDAHYLVGFSVSRLARCQQCRRFLWMARLRAEPFCSNRCRQTNWRTRNPEKYRQLQIESERRRAAKHGS
jgi:hypothetical protein